MGNQSQDVRNHNNNMQNQTQNETGVVTWSNLEESDEESVEYILTMMDIETESTTQEQAIFGDVIEEDNDQDDTEEEDDKNISLFEFKEEEELMNEDTNKQDEIEGQDEQHFGLANDLELTFNKNKSLLMDPNVLIVDSGS